MKKHGFRVLTLLSVLVMLASLLFSLPITASADKIADKKDELAELKQQQKDLEKEINALGDSIDDQKKKVQNLLNQVTNMEKQVDAYRKKIENLDQEIAEQEERIVALNGEIEAKQGELDEMLAKLKKRLRAIQMTGNYSSLQLLMDSDNYEDFLLKNKIVEAVAAHDKKLMDKADQEKKAIELKKKQVEEEKAETEAEKAEAETMKAELDANYTKLDSLYTKARTERDNLEKKLNTYEKRLKSIKEAEKKLDKEIEQLLAAQQPSGKYNGTMHWPVPGVYRISSHFGYRPSMGDTHGGTDIATPGCLGKSIVAAADGVVLKVQSMHYSYGNFAMIDHGVDAAGRRIVTLYAHMRYTPSVKVGQKVVGGSTVLGQVGNTGNSYGAHLHFEVRVDNVRVDAVKNGYIKQP